MTIANPTRLINQKFGSIAPSGDVNTIPDNDQTGTNPRGASFQTGFPTITLTPSIGGGLPPDGADMNGILSIVTDHTRFQNQGGVYKFDAALATIIGGYDIGCVLQSDDGTVSYVSAIDNNTINFNTTPSSIGVEWKQWAGGVTGAPVYTEDDKWELLPVGTTMPFIENIVGTSLAAWLSSHPHWILIGNVSFLDLSHTLPGSALLGRAMALPGNGHLSYSTAGSDNSTLVSHTHSANDVSHTHGQKDTLLFESGTDGGNVPVGGGKEFISGTGLAGSGKTDNDNHYSYYRKIQTDAANLTINVSSTGSGNGVNANIQRTVYLPWIIKIS